MELHAEDHGPIRLVRVKDSRIDAPVAIRFKELVREAAGDTAARVVLDLAEVTFLDSSGLGALVAAMKLIGPSRRLELACLQPAVERVFRLTRMDTVFTIHPTVHAALNAAAPQARAG